MKTPPAMFMVPAEVLLAITTVLLAAGTKFANKPEYVPPMSTVPPASGEKVPPLTAPLKVTVDPEAGMTRCR